MTEPKKYHLQWGQPTLNPKSDDSHRNRSGYRLFMGDRGAVRLEVPEGWFFESDSESYKFFDIQPPDDNCRLQISHNRLPPGDFSDFPLEKVLRQVIAEDKRNVLATGEVVSLERQAARLVWTETKFLDPHENRQAYSRICLGFGSGIQCLITLDYWVEDAIRLVPVWEHVLRSLVLGSTSDMSSQKHNSLS